MLNSERQAQTHRRAPWPAIAAGVCFLLLAAGLRASTPRSPSSSPRLLRGHTAGVLTLAFSPDGKILASGSWDGAVRLWDVATGEPWGAPLTGYAGGVAGLAFHPDGQTLLSAGLDRTVRLWDVLTGSSLGPPLTLPEPADSLAFRPDGALLAYSRCTRWEKTWCAGGEIVLWDTSLALSAGLATTRPAGPPLAGHEGIVESLAFSPDGRFLASGSWDTTVRLWDVSTALNTGTLAALRAGTESGQPIGPPLEWHTNIVTCLAFSPDGTVLASGSADRTVRLWDATTGAPIGQPLTGHTDVVLSVAFHPDGATLASGGYDGTVRLWNITTGQPIGQPLTAYAGAVTTVAFSPDGQILASGGENATVALVFLEAEAKLPGR